MFFIRSFFNTVSTDCRNIHFLNLYEDVKNFAPFCPICTPLHLDHLGTFDNLFIKLILLEYFHLSRDLLPVSFLIIWILSAILESSHQSTFDSHNNYNNRTIFIWSHRTIFTRSCEIRNNNDRIIVSSFTNFPSLMRAQPLK